MRKFLVFCMLSCAAAHAYPGERWVNWLGCALGLLSPEKKAPLLARISSAPEFARSLPEFGSYGAILQKAHNWTFYPADPANRVGVTYDFVNFFEVWHAEIPMAEATIHLVFDGSGRMTMRIYCSGHCTELYSAAEALIEQVGERKIFLPERERVRSSFGIHSSETNLGERLRVMMAFLEAFLERHDTK